MLTVARRRSAGLRRLMRARPLFDEAWAARNPALENIDVPALVCASFSDQSLHTRGSFEGFRRIASTQKWLYTHRGPKWATRSEEHTSELQSLMRISYAVFCLKKKKTKIVHNII